MDSAKQRVIDELNELSEKASKLTKYILSDKLSELSLDMKHLLQDQLRVMVEYGNILRRRIEIWGLSDEELYPDKHNFIR